MSKEARLARTKQLADQLISLPKTEWSSFPTFSDYDGPTTEELDKTLDFIKQSIEGLNISDGWQDLSWTTYTSLEGLIQNVHSVYAQFLNSKDQSSFQTYAQYTDSLAYHLRMFGAPFLSYNGTFLEKTSATLNFELDRLITARADLDKLRSEVQNLIAPAVAGSLSQAFTARKNTLLYGRVAWGVIAVALGIFCIYSTYDLANTVTNIFLTSTLAAAKTDLVWPSIIIRSVILLPLYAAFGFSFSQYKKERDFEEEYAHKAAVATSLPNYGDLTRDPAVRDQIVTGATNVIFSSPTLKKVDFQKQETSLSGVKEIIDSLSNLTIKKDQLLK